MVQETNLVADVAASSNTHRSNQVRSKLLYLAWGQALIATVGSLFFSEVMGFIPCILCWYQRILMYPLVIVLGVGILLRDQRVRYYVLPLSVLGIGIGLYHNLLYYGAIPEGLHICTSGVPCETRWIEWLGFVGIPFLSFTAFTVITLSLLWYTPIDAEEAPTNEPMRSSSEKTLKSVSALLLIVYAGIVIIAISSRAVTNAQVTDSFGGFSADVVTPEVTTALSSSVAATYPPELIVQGQQVFSRQCSACHGQNAQGITNLGLPLVDSAFIQGKTDAEMLEFIKTGRLPSDSQNQTGMVMPGKGGNPGLTDSEILAVIAYLRSLDQ
jgi:disulfide bond formation protein DsbB/mono/diheme cytochrome c family protein